MFLFLAGSVLLFFSKENFYSLIFFAKFLQQLVDLLTFSAAAFQVTRIIEEALLLIESGG